MLFRSFLLPNYLSHAKRQKEISRNTKDQISITCETSFNNFIIFEENLLFWQNIELNMHCAYDQKKKKKMHCAIFGISGDILKFEKVLW